MIDAQHGTAHAGTSHRVHEGAGDGASVRRPHPSDEDWLRDQLERGATIAELVELSGVARNTIVRWIQRHDLPSPARPRPRRPEPGELRRLMETTRSIGQAAQQLNVSPRTVSRWLNEAGDERPPVGRPRITVDLERLQQLRESNTSWDEIGHQLGVSRETARNAHSNISSR